MDLKIFPIPAFKDNYIWLIQAKNEAIIVDPGEANVVLEKLQKEQLKLAAILITHHHWDHTNGLQEILSHYQVPVYASQTDAVNGVNHFVAEKDVIELTSQKIKFKVIEIPCHTKGHVAYYVNGVVFTGDTLFTGGCGRLFEGTAEQMYQSLMKLRALPDETKVYCGHEYTEKNLQFAYAVEPNNQELLKRMEQTKLLRSKNFPTVPSTIREEKQTNPFLRCEFPEVLHTAEKYAGRELRDSTEVFTILRLWKDSF